MISHPLAYVTDAPHAVAEETTCVATHEALDEVGDFLAANPAFGDEFREHLPNPTTGNAGMAIDRLDHNVIAAKGEDLVRRNGQQKLLEKADARRRVDNPRPRPGYVDRRVRIVFGQRDKLLLVGVADMYSITILTWRSFHALQIRLVATGISWLALNQIVCALRFFYGVTLGHNTIPERLADT